MTAAAPSPWAAPNYASFTGSDATPLQQTFQSLSAYLEKVNNSVTIASGTGVTSLVAGTNITLSGSTGAVTINAAGGGVTSLAGTANQITVSASTGAITASFPTNLVLAGNVSVPADGKIIDTANANYFTPKDPYGNMYHKLTSGSFYVDANNYYFRNQAATNTFTIDVNGNSATRGNFTAYTGTRTINVGGWNADSAWTSVWGGNGYLLMGHSSDSSIYLRTSGGGNVNIGGNGNNTLIVGSGSASITGSFTVSSFIAQGGTGVTEGISTNNWFRPTGNSGLYFQSWGGGWHMTDGTWIRSYNGKNVYMDSEVRIGNFLSGNAGRSRGSYGGMHFGNNGATNNWDGIEWQSPYTQTLMIGQIGGAGYSGMYYNNNSWAWLWNYSTLVVGSDVRYKREIEPLTIGLNFIKALEPISYLKLTECTDDDPEATQDGYYYGFTAQNVRAALDACGETRDVRIHDIGGPNMGLVACTEDAVYDRQFLGLSEFLGPIVLAIQELEQRVLQLEGTV